MSIQSKDLTDEEKYFLLQLSYIDISRPKSYPESKKHSIEQILNDALKEKGLDSETRNTIIELKITYQRLIEKKDSLEDIRIIGYENHNTFGDSTDGDKTGFVGYALDDASGNRGFLFRGSENERVDWTDNISSGLTGSSAQVEQAREFFKKFSQDELGQPLQGISYSLYGHSKGNNLAAEVFVDNLDKDINAYGVNGAPIYWYDLTDEQRTALRGDRYTFIVHECDVVSSLGYVDYVDTVVRLENPDRFIDWENGKINEPFYPHKLTSVAFDTDGHFQSTRTPNPLGRQLWNTVVTDIDIAKQLVFNRYVNFFQDPFGIRVLTHIGKDLYHYTVDTVKVVWKYVAEEAYILADFIKNQCVATISRLTNWARSQLEDFKAWYHSVVGQTNSLIRRITDFSGGGSQLEDVPSAIRLHTVDLRNLTYRLQMIQNKIANVDQKLDTLAMLIGPEDIHSAVSVMSLDMRLGYDHQLQRCMDYLSSTADRLEQCESRLINKAHAF